MDRVLQIVDSMDAGGIQAFIMNVYRNIDRKEIQFDFLIFRGHKQWYEEEILNLGGKIFKAPGRRDGIIKCNQYLNNFFKLHSEYNVIHYNASSLSFVAPLCYAKKYGVNKRIIHCHSSSFLGGFIHKYLHRIHKTKIHSLANIYLSCSKTATEWMFWGTSIVNQVKMITNGIECDRYLYSAKLTGRFTEISY